MPIEMKKFIAFTFVFIALLIAISSIFTPSKNNNPEKQIIIYGKFPFEHDYNIEITQYAYSASKFSKLICGGFGFVTGDETGISCESAYEIRELKQIGCCSYEVVIYEDYYSPGLLDWKTAPILVSVHHKNTKSNVTRKSISLTNKNYICTENISKKTNTPDIYCNEQDPLPSQSKTGKLEINYSLLSAKKLIK